MEPVVTSLIHARRITLAWRAATKGYWAIAWSWQVGGPGFLLVFVTPCERAAWISKRHAPELFDGKRSRTTADGFQGYRCGLFRNESDHRASDLIRAAVALTERFWGPSAHGWLTYVDKPKIASENPGYCFKKAGWILDRDFEHDCLIRLNLLPVAQEVAA
jgi:hypothetical protein